jgi:hypothetical protein
MNSLVCISISLAMALLPFTCRPISKETLTKAAFTFLAPCQLPVQALFSPLTPLPLSYHQHAPDLSIVPSPNSSMSAPAPAPTFSLPLASFAAASALQLNKMKRNSNAFWNISMEPSTSSFALVPIPFLLFLHGLMHPLPSIPTCGATPGGGGYFFRPRWPHL